LLQWSKTKIVQEATRLKLPIAETWSCYAGGEKPCGICDSCRIRDAAFLEAGRSDLVGQ
jgi:7-cyano-7-deazaguanine synthase